MDRKHAPSLRTPTKIFRMETPWCEQCDMEIYEDQTTMFVNTSSGAQDKMGPYHYDCARKVRNALNEHEQSVAYTFKECPDCTP